MILALNKASLFFGGRAIFDEISFQINPGGNVSGGYDELFPNSRLKVNLKATMPLSIGVNDLIIKDTFDLKLFSKTN